MIRTALLTISSTRVTGDDISGDRVAGMLGKEKYDIICRKILRDDRGEIAAELVRLADETGADFVLTVGGTGFGPYDVTPEATLDVVEKVIPGLPEIMRAAGIKSTGRAALSRGAAGIRGSTLILNLPGSPGGAQESLESVLDLVPHAMEMIKGGKH
ncbi:MAG: MogA/MoaB family molybdenum cofactor biosynthesis protein [Elusimicrobia bacterium]|nr:MogA/MoaB family molybdenum cofactor biosynthesis protein [Elusimicrobiota bacterium]